MNAVVVVEYTQEIDGEDIRDYEITEYGQFSLKEFEEKKQDPNIRMISIDRKKLYDIMEQVFTRAASDQLEEILEALDIEI